MGHQGHGSLFFRHQVISVTALETRFSAGCDLKTPDIKVIGKSHIIILADIELKDRLKARAGLSSVMNVRHFRADFEMGSNVQNSALRGVGRFPANDWI